MTTLIPKFKQALTGSVNRDSNLKLAETVSIKDFGAVGDNLTDDTAAIQAALNSITNGGCILIPTGQYKITSTLIVPGDVGIKGESSTGCAIQAYSCNALQFTPNGGIGPVPLEDFAIFGNNCQDKIGMYAPGTIETSDKVSGLRITRLRVQGFQDAINFRTVWDASIKNCVLYNNIWGVVIRGQSVKILIEDNYINHNLLGGVHPNATGVTVTSTADYNPGGTTNHRPEDVQIVRNWIAGFPFGLAINAGLYIQVLYNDIDLITLRGIDFTTVGATFNITGNWIGLVGTGSMYGIFLNALSTSGNIVKNITNNEINSVNLSTGNGIYCFSNQHNVNITGNSITNFANDINIQNCGDITIQNNRCNTVGADNIYIISSTAAKTIQVDNNTLAGALYLHPSANSSQIVIGQNDGLSSTYIRGKSVIAAGATTVTTTYASLTSTPPDFQAAGVGYIIPKLFLQTPAANIGYVYGTASTSQVVINCSSAPVADLTIYWEVKGFAFAL